ncbi:MAG TPA: FCD domain-containing protein, partial [Microbacterium sp.]|nr:FCD domain-containing protein [Microbacterium sp.]
IAIEAEASSLAAERRTASDLRAIRRALAARDNDADGIEAHVDADTAFHRSIIVAAHNPILLELFDGFTPRLRQAMIEMLRLRSDHDGPGDHERHARLADAVSSKDAATAASESRAHLRRLKEALR